MCGIVGFVGAGTAADLDNMTRAIRHRGPDDSGSFIAPDYRVHLGSTRLAIIDLDGGKQPMQDPASRYTVTFNGEIYNHSELRRELEAAGRRFLTDHSDTEVLVHGYAEWGDSLPLRLNGMFGFAIFDSLERKLFLARDRFGEKPLYYARIKDSFLFASELSALRAHSEYQARLHKPSLQKYFAHGFLPAPNAIYKDTWKLPHGHSLTLDVDSGRTNIACYWRFSIETAPPRPEKDLIEELRDRLATAVRRRLMSDVPIGVFLSGGVDSSAIAALAAQHIGPDRLHTFTVGFDDAEYDESPFAKKIAEFLGNRHHEIQLEANAALELLPDVLGRLDEPLGDPSILPTFLLSRFARQSVTVALGGDAGDELFAGYDTFAALRIARIYELVTP